MAFDLNPVAVTAAPLLRAIKAGDWSTRAELAQAAGRVPNHIARDIGVLVKADLVEERADDACGRPVVLTDAGEAQLAALDRAADPNGGGPLTALLGRMDPHPLNPRKDFESDDAEEGLSELRESILLRGLMQPIVVRPAAEAGRWWIVDGERRFRAIRQANWDGDWADDQPVPIVVREVDDREHLLLSLTANLQRANMSAIEEADAFHAAVHDFGLSTEALADELGKSQRYVQQRIALLKLPEAARDRMRLPKGHPDHLSFKAARTLGQTPREPVPEVPYLSDPDTPARSPGEVQDFVHAVSGRLMVEYGTTLPEHLQQAVEQEGMRGETIDGSVQRIAAAKALKPLPKPGEPGAPQPSTPEPKPFGATLTDREALLLVEVADKAERDPDPDLASEHYTRVQITATQGMALGLVTRGLIGFRQRGMTVLIRPRLFSSGLKEWLDEIGFNGEHRADVLFEMRARVHGADVAGKLAADGLYATAWLNPAGDPMQDGGEGMMPGPREAMADYAAERRAAAADDADPHQPELIEATDDEKAERQRVEDERNAEARARNAADLFARQIGDWMAFARTRGARDYLNPCFDAGPNLSPEDMAVALVKAVATGKVGEAGALLAVLHIRVGAMGSARTLEQMPDDVIARAVVDARNPALTAAEAEDA